MKKETRRGRLRRLGKKTGRAKWSQRTLAKIERRRQQTRRRYEERPDAWQKLW